MCMIFIEDGYFKFQLCDKLRFDGLIIGGVISVTKTPDSRQKRRNLIYIVGIFLLAGALCHFTNNIWTYQIPHFRIIGYTTLSLFFGILVSHTAAEGTNQLSKLLKNQILVKTGRISYGIYIIHWPVYIILMKSIEIQGKQDQYFISLFSLIITLSLALLSNKYYERIFWKQRSE